MDRYRVTAWGLTLVSIIWTMVAGNVAAVPNWTIAIPWVVTGFWWAFGHEVLPEPRPGRQRDRTRYRSTGPVSDDGPGDDGHTGTER